VERIGVERSRRAAEQAELVLALVDGSRKMTTEDEAILRFADSSGKPWILVQTKKDLTENAAPIAAIGKDAPPCVAVSALTGEGMEALEAAVKALCPMPLASGGTLLTNARQAESVRRALESIRASLEALRSGITPDAILTEIERAQTALGELTGRTAREDMVSRIFERFCVGK